MQIALMIVYILTTDYYVAPMVQKEWHYRDGIKTGLGIEAPTPRKKAMPFNEKKTNGTHLTPTPPPHPGPPHPNLTKYMTLRNVKKKKK